MEYFILRENSDIEGKGEKEVIFTGLESLTWINSVYLYHFYYF